MGFCALDVTKSHVNFLRDATYNLRKRHLPVASNLPLHHVKAQQVMRVIR